MGLDSGLLNPQQVKVSSAKNPNFQGQEAALSATVGWIPLLNSPSEWIQVSGVKQLKQLDVLLNIKIFKVSAHL